MLEIEVESTDAYTLCRPVGELDAYTVNEFREALGGVTHAQRLLIDLSAVPFADSTAAHALLSFVKKTQTAGTMVYLAGASAGVRHVLFQHGLKPPLGHYSADVETAREEALQARGETAVPVPRGG